LKVILFSTVNQRRQARADARPGADEARALILRFGWNATGYQILNPGFTLWFSGAGDAVIGYVGRSRTRVVGGAPICDGPRLLAVTEEFVRDARRHGESVCFFGAGARLERTLAGGSWSSADLGAQPSWDPRNWDDVIRRRSSVRAQLNRARNKGVEAVVRDSVDESEAQQLQTCLSDWLRTRRLPPLHFLVEPDTLALLEDRFLVVAYLGDTPCGYLVASPVGARNGWLVEQIVRGRSAPNGSAELMIDAAMREMARRGAVYATLGLCPLSRHSRSDDTRMPRWLRFLLRWIRAHGNRYYNFEGLDAFKSKFEPEEWEDIVALTHSRKFPPKALWAIAGAFAGGSPLVLGARVIAKALLQELRWIVTRAG
jgi:phosphatidylglycerol lysyltransferase